VEDAGSWAGANELLFSYQHLQRSIIPCREVAVSALTYPSLLWSVN
jgi:hypothetical protein